MTNAVSHHTVGQRISYRFLISLYVILPALFLLIVVDTFVLNRSLQQSLPRLPESILLISLLFPFPHIIASYFSFADTAYLRQYSKRLLIGIPILVFLTLLATWYDKELAFLLFVIYSMIHITFQQTGISQMMVAKSNIFFVWWKWAICTTAIFLYLSLYPSSWKMFAQSYFPAVLLVGTVVAVIVGIFCMREVESKIGQWYFWGTTLLIPAGAIFIKLGYPIFAILLPRFIHDLTAFAFYATHDVNRNSVRMHNFLYRFFTTPSYVWILYALIPAFAILLAFLFTLHPYGVTYGLVSVSIVHYYIESFMWKKGSPHRQEMSFSK